MRAWVVGWIPWVVSGVPRSAPLLGMHRLVFGFYSRIGFGVREVTCSIPGRLSAAHCGSSRYSTTETNTSAPGLDNRKYAYYINTVSYTHLTLPTNDLV